MMRRRARPYLAMACATLVVLLAAGCGRPRTGPATLKISDRGPGSHQRVDDIPLTGRRSLDLDHVDPARYAAALGNSPERIFEFVRDRIAFEAYPGVLRGPRGTLLALAGNGADRALLLAELLRSAGQRVQFAQGALPDSTASELVTTMWAVRPSPAASPNARGAASPDGLIATIKRNYAAIATQLKKVPPASPRAEFSVEALVADTRTHVWVQWNRSGQWVDLDPLFSDTAVGKAYTRAEKTSETLPDAMFHRVAVHVRVEEDTDGVRRDREVLSFTSAAADLSGRDLLLLHQPENWRGPVKSLGGALSAAMQETGRVRPVLVAARKDLTVGEPFRVRDPRGIGGVQSILGGSSRKPEPRATAEFVDVEISAPDGRKHVVVREIFDVIGGDLRSRAPAPREEELRRRWEGAPYENLLLSAYDLFFTTGRVHVSHLANLPAEAPLNGDQAVDIRTSLRRISVMATVVLDGLAGRFGKPDRAVIVLYPDAPRVYIADFRSDGRTRRISMDLRNDHVRAVALGPAPGDVRSARILRGVIGGSIEHALLDYFTAAARAKGLTGSVMSTSLITWRAQQENVPNVLLPGQFAQLDGGVPADSIARIRELAKEGWVAVAPARSLDVDGKPRFAWWLVDPASGETIPVTDEGLHQAATENEVMVVEKEDSTGQTAYYVASKDGTMVFLQGPYFSGDAASAQVGKMLAEGFVEVQEAPWLPMVWR